MLHVMVICARDAGRSMTCRALPFRTRGTSYCHLTQAQQTIPANSPLAQIHKGMSKAEMLSLLGPPTDQDTSVTGKAFIPFYFGGDATATRLHYKGLGRVYVSGQGTFGGGEKVLKIEYDPQEPGLRK